MPHISPYKVQEECEEAVQKSHLSACYREIHFLHHKVEKGSKGGF